MKKSILIFLHLGFWLCYSLLILLFFGMLVNFNTGGKPPFKAIANLIFGTCYLPALITFYSFYFILFPKFLLKKKILKLCLYSVLVSVVASFIGTLTMNLIVPGATIRDGSVFTEITIFITFIAFIPGVVALVIRGFVAWYEDLKIKQELTEKNNEMEMALVKAQLDPHFLFNTLNNIDVLIQKDAEEASKYLNKLSDIMRFMLFETKTDRIDLTKELEYLGKYIDLQKIRSSNPKFVRLTINGDSQHKKISPMVFIPFIENAFKHVADKKTENAIDINIIIEDNKILFECTNNSSNTSNSIDGYNGLGNELIQKRLNLLYPNSHNLTIENQASFYKVILAINYD
jgi:two-component system LytT family sensor kinase